MPSIFKSNTQQMETSAADVSTGAPNKWDFSCNFGGHAALAVDKEVTYLSGCCSLHFFLRPDKVKSHISVSHGKLSVHFEALEARFLRASYSAFVDVLTLATTTIEEFGQELIQ